MTNSWRDCIEVEELPELYRVIAEAIGREAMIDLTLHMQKMNLYLKRLPADYDPARLSEDYLIAAEAIGLENVILLAAALPKELNYLKSADEVFLPAKIRWIRANFNGANHRRLGLATGLSQRYIYQIFQERKWQQLGLFATAV